MSNTQGILSLLTLVALFLAVQLAVQLHTDGDRAPHRAHAADLDRLDQLAEQFALKHPETLDPAAVRLGCASYSQEFAELLLDNHFAVQTVVVGLGHYRPRPDVYPDQAKPGEEPPPHWYVRVLLPGGGERNYDWTIRQYRADADVPFVWEAGR